MQALEDVLDEMHLYLGPNCQEFERECAAFCNTKFAIGVGSGTEAIQLALLASGVKSGDEVITSPHTFFATAEAIAVIAQIDDDTMQTMAKLLYGSGLRLMECARLRIKDVDFQRKQLLVRDGKGTKTGIRFY